MKKLIELLNKYEAKLEEMPLTRERWREENWILYRRFMNVEDAERMVISKSFWFIKRLLDKEKIDLLRLSCTAIRYTEIIDADFSREDIIIMILAIQDNPIKFLIDYLK